MNSVSELKKENEELRRRLIEAEESLDAIRQGQVDAIVVEGAQGAQVFSLSGAEHIYRMLVETMYEGAMTVSLEGTVLFCNQRLCELVKFTSSEIVGKNIGRIVAGEYHQELSTLLDAVQLSPAQQRLVFTASDRTPVPVQLSATKLETDDKPTICIVVADLTELEASADSLKILREHQKAMESVQRELRQSRNAALNLMEDAIHARDALKESENRMKRAQEIAHLGSWEYDPLLGKFTWSDEMYRIFGISPQEFDNTYKGFSLLVHPEDRAEVEAVYSRSLIEPGSRNMVEHRVIRKDTGQIRYVYEKWENYRDQTGQVVRSTGMALDITGTKLAEINLKMENRQTVLVNRILRLFMEETGESLFGKIIDSFLESSQSSQGFFCYMSEPGIITCPTKIKELDPHQEKNRPEVPEKLLSELWSRALKEKRSFFTDGPAFSLSSSSTANHLSTPVLFQGQVIGLVNQFNKIGGYTIEDLELTEGIAARIAPVLYAWMQRRLREEERKQALEEQNRALRRFELLAGTAGELLQAKEPQRLLETLCLRVMQFLNCHVFFNYLVDEDKGQLHLNACTGIPESEARGIEWIDYGTEVCGYVALEGHRIVAEHIPSTQDSRTDLVRSYGVRAYACHPLLGPGHKVIGTLSFGTKTRETFSSEELDLMRAVADQIAAAMIRMRSEEQLKKNREDLNRAQAVGSIGSWRFKTEKNTLTMSDENYRIFGIPPGTYLTFERALAAVHPDDRDYLKQQLYSATASGNNFVAEHRLIVEGRIKWVRETAEIEIDPAGRLQGCFGTTQDITYQKMAEEELQRYRAGLEKLVDERTQELRNSQEQLLHAQKMEALGQLAGGIAHDFNNMMQVISGYTHRVLRKFGSDHRLRENLEYIEQAAKSATSLTHRLLAFSRKQMLQPQVFSLNDLILKIKPMLRHTLGEDVKLSWDLKPDLGRIKADPAQLEQVIMNMVVNARNAMPNGGKLHFQTTDVVLSDIHPYEKDPVPAGPYVMLVISDSGCGMEQDLLDKIFEPFFTTKPFGSSGSGLGLSMAYGTIRQSSGVIRVYSEPGKGTTFKIYLPRSDEEVFVTESVNSDTSFEVEGKTILIVEDNTMAREFASQEISDMGYNVLSASSGEEAFTISRTYSGSIQLLLTDVVLPGVNGWEVSKILSSERPEMATLFMSGYDKDHIVNQGKIVPGARLLAKPFSPEQLASALRDALVSTFPMFKRSEPKSGLPRKTTDVTGTPMRVLVVDDEPAIAEIIAEVLEEPGNIVQSAENGAAALQLASETPPDIVLLDIRLPDMDGYELSRRIRELHSGSRPYIIAASGYTPDRRAAEEAFDDYLIKPIDFNRLKNLIAAHSRK